jgi:hypothetical protein
MYNTLRYIALAYLTFPFYDLSVYSCDIPFSTP